MHERELFDETLDINSTDNYEISIQVSLDGFSFCILDTLRKRFVMLREYRLTPRADRQCDQVLDIINNDEFLSRHFRRYRIIFSSAQTTLVPSGLYDPALKDDYFRINYRLEEGHIISNNRLNEPDAFLLFDVNRELLDLLVTAFPEASLSHNVRALLFGGFRQSAGSGARYIHINIEDNYFNLFIIEDKKLSFINSFKYRNSSDILYYMLHTFEQLGVTKDATVWVSGRIEKFDELHNNMSRYVKKIRFAAPAGPNALSYIFDTIGTHRYLALFNITSCA